MNFKKPLCFIFLMLCFVAVKGQVSEAFKKEIFVKASDTLLYRIMLPEHFSKTKEYPIVFMLHGAGERGNDNEKQLLHGSSLFYENRNEFPAIVIFPQCPKNDYWANVSIDRSKKPLDFVFQYNQKPTKALGLVISLLDELLKKPFVKKEQVYLMGLSMGGMGTFELLTRKPNLFAGAIPICAAGDPAYVNTFANKVPIWGFHGAMDTVVDPQYTLAMVAAILKVGGKPKLTIYDNANHNSWDAAFAEPALLPWLFSKYKKI